MDAPFIPQWSFGPACLSYLPELDLDCSSGLEIYSLRQISSNDLDPSGQPLSAALLDELYMLPLNTPCLSSARSSRDDIGVTTLSLASESEQLDIAPGLPPSSEGGEVPEPPSSSEGSATLYKLEALDEGDQLTEHGRAGESEESQSLTAGVDSQEKTPGEDWEHHSSHLQQASTILAMIIQHTRDPKRNWTDHTRYLTNFSAIIGKLLDGSNPTKHHAIISDGNTGHNPKRQRQHPSTFDKPEGEPSTKRRLIVKSKPQPQQTAADSAYNSADEDLSDCFSLFSNRTASLPKAQPKAQGARRRRLIDFDDDIDELGDSDDRRPARKRWSPKDDKDLRTYVQAGEEWPWIASKLQRTELAAKQHWNLIQNHAEK
jgi:hypothetical protein